MALSEKSVVETRDKFDVLVAARETSKAGRDRAVAFMEALKAVRNTADALRDAEALPQDSLPPFDIDEAVAEQLEAIAKSWQAQPSEEIVALRGELTNMLGLAEAIGISDEVATTVRASLAREKGSNAASETRQRAASGDGKSAILRSLPRIPNVVSLSPTGERLRPDLKPTAENGTRGNWNTGRWEVKRVVNRASEAAGGNVDAEWTEFTAQLVPVEAAMLAGDDVDVTLTDAHGNTFHITY